MSRGSFTQSKWRSILLDTGRLTQNFVRFKLSELNYSCGLVIYFLLVNLFFRVVFVILVCDSVETIKDEIGICSARIMGISVVEDDKTRRLFLECY